MSTLDTLQIGTIFAYRITYIWDYMENLATSKTLAGIIFPAHGTCVRSYSVTNFLGTFHGTSVFLTY